MKNYYSKPKMSSELCKKIMYFYVELLKSYRIMTPPEIAKELGIRPETMHIFYSLYLEHQEEVTDSYVMIMLCTKFGNTSIYREEQKKVYGGIIKQRQEIREAAERRKKIHDLVIQKAKEHMEKKKNREK